MCRPFSTFLTNHKMSERLSVASIMYKEESGCVCNAIKQFQNWTDKLEDYTGGSASSELLDFGYYLGKWLWFIFPFNLLWNTRM